MVLSRKGHDTRNFTVSTDIWFLTEQKTKIKNRSTNGWHTNS